MALTRADWARSGLAALAEGGLPTVAVEAVARRLGATKGSFYWHFSDRDDFLVEVLTLWEDLETTQLVAALEAVPDPRGRLVVLGRSAYERANGGGAHAALLVAAEDPRVQPVLARVTRTRLEVLERLYGDLGLEVDDANRYARLAYVVYLGTTDLRRAEQSPVLDDEELERRVALFVSVLLPTTGAAT